MNELGSLLSSLTDADSDALFSLLGSLLPGTPESAPQAASTPPAPSRGEVESTGLDQLLQTLAGLGSDKNIRLLEALRPHLSPARAKRADDLIKIFRILQFAPLVITPGFLGGESK